MRKLTNVKKNLVPAVCKAVRGLHETRGSSLQSIATFIQATGKPDAVAPTLRDVKVALRVAEANKKLIVTNGRFLLPSSVACPKKKKVSRKKRGACQMKKKSKSHKRKASNKKKSSHKKKKSLCKPRCQSKKRSRRQKRKCSRPCTRMWKPKKGKKCVTTDENSKQDAASIEPTQIKVENP